MMLPPATLRFLAVMVLAALLAACGQSGPLYLQDDEPSSEIEDEDTPV